MKYILSKEWLRNLCLWAVLMLVFFVNKPQPLTNRESLIATVSLTVLYASIWLNNIIISKFWLEKGKFFLYFIALLPILTIYTMVHWWANHNIAFIADNEPWNLFDAIFNCLLFLFIGFGFNSAYREIMRRQASLETELLAKRNELRFLQNQVNPHFLFNSLNNLYSSSLAEPGKVSGHILQMADLLRYQLSSAKREFVPLVDEVDFLKNYMDIEARRLGQQVVLEVETMGNFEGKNIAPLLFLPFLENAFKYATGGISTAKIEVRIISEARGVQFFVKNSVPENIVPMPVSTGIGIENAQKRLELAYPNQFLLLIKPAATEFWVDLKIKFPNEK